MIEAQITEATPEVVGHIISNLWERGQRELEILGIEPASAIAIMDHQRSLGAPTMAIWFDGEPVVFCALMRTDDPLGMVTAFQATELFSHYVVPITKLLRRALERSARQYGLEFIEIFSPCVHPRTGRWFEALGFRLDLNRFIPAKNGGGRLYRFERRFPKGVMSDVLQ